MAYRGHEAYDHHEFLPPSVTATYRDVEDGTPVSIIELAANRDADH